MNINKILLLLNFLDFFNLTFLKIFLRKHIVMFLLIIKNDLLMKKNNELLKISLFIIIGYFLLILKK